MGKIEIMTNKFMGMGKLKDRVREMASSQKNFHPAEIYLIIVLLVFGLSACFLLPVSGGYDEETHLMRVWEMSSFNFLPNEKLGYELPFPAVYWEMSYRRQVLVSAVEKDFWEKYGKLAIDAHDYIYGKVETRSKYSPPLLLPQALTMRYLGRKFQFPALPVFYACRLVGLFCYLVLAWFSVRIIPLGKWILALLAAAPVAVLQAATVSADTISNGIGLLFIAGSLALVVQEEIRWKEWLSFVILFLILFWGKPNLIPLAILPFLLLKPSQFKMRVGYFTLAITVLALFLLEVVGWNILVYSRLPAVVGDVNPAEQIKFILTHPFNFAAILTGDIQLHGVEYFQNWLAIYGFNYWPVSVLIYYLFMFALLGALFLRDGNRKLDQRQRIILVIVFLINYLGTIFSLYVAVSPVASKTIDGVQGRYFVTVMPLLFLALACLPLPKRVQIPSLLPVVLGVVSLIIYTAGMYLSYHVPCGSQFYQPGLCYQPNYKNWAPDDAYSPPINNQLTLSQEIVPECNGLSELRVWINAQGSDPNGISNFILTDMNAKHEIVNINVPNSELPVRDWYSLKFPPDWVSNGKLYVLKIQSSQSGMGPRISYSLRPEYTAGKMYENDQASTKDMIFQTGCIAGWDKLRLTGSP